MIQYEKITCEVARVAFQRMKESGSRLPWGELDKIFDNSAEFLQRKVESSRASMRAGLGLSNEEVEAKFAAKRDKIGKNA